MENVRLWLSESFDFGMEHWERVDSEKGKWYLYSVFNPVLDYEYYIVFKYRYTKAMNGTIRQLRPAHEYETNTRWFKVCDDEDDAYKWLIDKKLIKS